MSSPSDKRPSARQLTGGCSFAAVGYTVDDASDNALNGDWGTGCPTTGAAFKPFAAIPRNRLTPSLGADCLGIYGDDPTNSTLCAPFGTRLSSIVRDGNWCRVAIGTFIDAPTILPSEQITKAPQQYQEVPE